MRGERAGHEDGGLDLAQSAPVEGDLAVPVERDLRVGEEAETEELLAVAAAYEYIEAAADTGRIGGGTLEVSFDDGATWTAVALDGVRGKSAAWEGTVRVPADARYLSARASAKDDKSGSVTQKIIRAVGVK
ncbi:hypothetical protein [Streptomyces peucetius]|uniref:Uncharacterized protein n=1 Tax=Streptomyces peucetius TaxID=1950 RepID=A0ABY6I4R2_STRPE|nr:hypothetical protein [Streptomyces peucetius]UYQ61968.1 hypothetical protein OGH68_10990 [Streptomyces peucetius]